MEVSISAQDKFVPTTTVPTNTECISSSCFPGILRAHVQRKLEHASISHPELAFYKLSVINM